MNAKKYLSQALWLDQIIKSKLEQLERLKSLATKVASNLTEPKVQNGNKVKSPMENAIVKITELEEEINHDIEKHVNLKFEIRDTIKQVDDLNAKLILEERYICGKSWEEISCEQKYSISAVFYLHGKGLKEIEKIKKFGVN